MFKKYRFLIFFCFLVMLTGVSLLSIDKVEHVLVEDDNQESSNAASNKCWLVMNTNIRDKNGTGLIGMNIELYLSSGYSGDYNWKYHFYTYSTYVGGTREGSLDQVWLQFYRGICIETTCDYTGRKTTWVGYKGTDSSNSNVYGELLNSSIVKIEADGTNLGEVTMGSLTTNGFKKDKKYDSDKAAPTFTLTFYPKILYNFDYNGGKSDGKTNSSIVYDSKDNHMELWDGTEKNNIAVPVRDGYTFKGYYTAKTGGSQIINANGKWTGTWNLSNVRCAPLYAQWTANKYTVSYNLDGGSYGTYHPTSWTYNTAQQISNPTRTHYDFAGWSASNLTTSTAVYGTGSNPTTSWNGTTKIKASSTNGALYFKNLRSTSGTVTLTANWTAKQYTLTFNANGGSVSTATRQVAYGSTYGTLPTPTRTGYTFVGWYTAASGGNQVTSSTRMTTAGATIYAHWTANTYTVKFNDQGGTTNFADMVLIDSTYKTNGTYTFTRNGVTVTYDVSDSALTLNGKPTNDINLFINLGLSFTQNNVYKVSYQKISGSMSGNTTGCFVLEVCDASWALLETRNRVDFHMNNSSGSANLTISSSGATNGAGLKLWFWCNENATPSRVFNNFKVKFKIEKSGTQNVQKQTRFTYGSPLEAVAPPTRVGYNFQGYYTQTGGGGTRYFDSSGHPVVSTMNIANNTTTLHAYWTIKTDCTIYYDSSAAGNFDNWTKYTYGDRIDSSYDESSQTNTINITGGGGWETMAIPIYFPTTGVRYTITFNYSGTFKYLSGYNGLRMQLLTSQPAAGNNQNIQAAYANLTSHSAGTTASATISITPSQNIYYLTLNLGYLKDDDPYTLTFNNFNFTSTSGEAARVYQSGHTFNQAVTNLLVPADRGSIFTGWVTESGKAFNSGSTMNAEEIYLNAQWADTWGNHYSSALTQDTSDDYWMISSSKDLARLIYLFNYTTRIDVLKMKFKLTNHIDMSDHYWLPLGTEDRVFSALIDGRGYTISGLKTISQSLRKDNGGDNSGFIGVSGSYTEKSSTGVTTTYKATIKNIYFEDISINGRNYVAGVVGSVLGDTTISAIAVVGKIYGTNIRGGIAAYAPSTSLATISDCLVDVSPSNIVIRNNYITATNSVNYSTGKLAKTSGTFTNWIENLTGMKYTMLPKGLTWIAEGK